jgi:glycopeptide antibiotics resistance protein
MFWRYNRAAFFWAILILILCGLPGSNFPKLSFLDWLRPDKIVHLILFGIQSYLLIIGFIRQDRFPALKANAIRWGVLLSISYGALVEVLQATIFIGRSGDIRDVLANSIGAIIGLYFFRKYGKRQVTGHSEKMKI